MVPIEGDPLFKKGFQPTDWYNYTARNATTKKYHFLLSLGFITLQGGAVESMELATFPSLYNTEEGFTNPQVLEPGYTASTPAVAAKLANYKDAIIAGAGGGGGAEHLKFAFFDDLNPVQQGAVDAGHTAYNRGRSIKERALSKQVFHDFLEFIDKTPCIIVHKGANDLVALKNTCKALKVTMPNLETIDLDHYNRFQTEVPNKKLDTLQNFWADSLPPLAAMRAGLLQQVAAYIVARWGEEARESVAAHNPLVDCVYAAVVLEGLKQHEPTAAGLMALLTAAAAPVAATAAAATAAAATATAATAAAATAPGAAGRGGTRRLSQSRHRYKQIRH